MLNIDLKNITTANFCFVDTSEKIKNFEIDFVEIMIDVNKTIIDNFCFEVENVSTIIINDLKTVVDNFDERFDFFLKRKSMKRLSLMFLKIVLIFFFDS